MSSKLFKVQNKNKMALLFASLGTVGTIGSLTVVSASADTTNTDDSQGLNLASNVTADSFDLTQQATGNLTFPVQFDRPSGVNAAALAGTVIQLGSSSTLYKSALAAVPDLSNTTLMNGLLSDALDSSNANYATARADIVKLINWYNSLGGQQITTQSGAAYTVDNLDDPINVLAVAFSNNNSINSAATTALSELNSAKTVGDVETALEKYKSGVSTPYTSAFEAYAQKVYASGADLNALSQYSALEPVLDAYESMYANGAAAIRTTLLNGQATSTEAGVTFFESAVIAGSSSDTGGDGSNSNTPTTDTTYTTKYVDQNGNNLATPETSSTGYDTQKTFTGYTYVSNSTDSSTNTKTYVYQPTAKTADTTWVDEDGNTLKAKAEGTLPDDGTTVLFPGYVVISTKTTQDADGNSHTVNTYHKTTVDTSWVDTDGNTLKATESGDYPDNDGTSDIAGYDLVSVKTNTDANGDMHVINTYEKTAATTHTTWVDEDGNTLKAEEDGNHPDNDGVSDIPGYTLVSTTTDADGNTINTYKKDAASVYTYWYDTDGNSLKDKEEGTFPDTDHNDIAGYTWKSTYTVTAADIAANGSFYNSGFAEGDTINIYEKDATSTVVTKWVDTDGNTLQAQKTGSYPDNDGVSDIKGYTLVRTDIDSEGNVTNVYTKDTAQVTTSWVDEDGNKLSDDVTGDNFGDQKTFDGYTFDDVTVSSDGTHKTYVYKKDVTPTSAASVASSAASVASVQATEISSASTAPSSASPVSSVISSASTSVIPQTGYDEGAATVASELGLGLLSALGLSGLAAKRRRNRLNNKK